MSRYSIQNFKRLIKNPRLSIDELRRWTRIPLYKVNDFWWDNQSWKTIEVMEHDWDNLILLDACRYDYFSTSNELEGDLLPVLSKGRDSWEFMEKNFVGQQFHDTVYVTANPHVAKLEEDVFYTVEPLLNMWDEEIGTVLPEDVVAAAKNANETYPNKRLLIHFMQPHKPHIGPTAENIRNRVNLRGWDKYHGLPDRTSNLDGMTIWTALHLGIVSHDELRQMYQESLDIVLEHVDDLVSSLNGKSVVSADHGELLGEEVIPLTGNRYGHPTNVKTTELYEVPWLILDAEERRQVESDLPIGFNQVSDEVVTHRLKALGYNQ